MAAVLLVIGITFAIDWHLDNRLIKLKANEIVAGLTAASDRIVAVNHWVYENQGFAKNQQFFLLKQLGPTPLQVMRGGGDCADKARLEAALLEQLGISSGLMMIAKCADCAPVHTVVEAEHEAGRMIVDPIWDVVYFDSNGRYASKDELAGNSLAWAYVTALKQERGPGSKINFMPFSDATFDYVFSINWHKNGFMQTLGALLGMTGLDPATILRPRVLEDPKLFLATAHLMLSLGVFLFGFVLSFWLSRTVTQAVSNRVALT